MRRLGLWLLAAWLAFPAAADAWFAPSEALAAIRKKGEIAIGVKTDFPPFAMLDADGRPAGLEIDLAQRIADGLGVRLRTVGVSTDNRFNRLEQGSVDLIIATAGDTQERRKLATVIEPNYYGAGVSVLLRPDRRETDWQEIRGQTLCALQGAYFNKPITQRYILNLQMYLSVRDAQLALKNGHCIGFLYTDVAIQQYLKQPEWQGYKEPFASAFVIPWAISIARSERDTDFERLVGDLVAQWHRDGSLIQLEEKWGIQPSQFLREANALWNRRDADGRLLCERDAHGHWPVPCRNAAFVTSTEVEGVQGLGLWLRETLDLDISPLYDPYDGKRYLRGIVMTMLLCAASVVGSLLLGYLGARLILNHHVLLGGLVRLLSAYGRMTPPLLQMYLLFFGLGSWLWSHGSISLSPFAMAVCCLSYYHGSIIVFTLVESAELVRGRQPGFRLTRTSWPQLIGSSAVGIRTALTNLSKATSIASAIAVPELLSATVAIIADQGNVNVMMSLLLLMFYLMSSLWLHLLVRLERKVLRAVGAP